jgi:hypothetical protein
MKKILAIIALSSVLFACNNKAKEEEALKQQEIQKQLVLKAVKDSLRLDSFKREEVAKKEQLAKEAAEAKLVAERKAIRSAKSSNYSGSGSTTTSYGGTQATAKKKGWSDAAKGTVIGGVAGAVGGAIIDKKKGRGAVIGGVAGAGAGYLIGRGEDKKSGRAN